MLHDLGGLEQGVSLGQGVQAMESVAKEKLDDRFVTRWTGSARDFQESSSSLGAVFGMAILAVFLLLAAQFEPALAVCDPADGAVGAGGGVGSLVVGGNDHEPVQPDRFGAAGGIGDKKRHPDRGVRHPAPGNGLGSAGGGGRRGHGPTAPHPH
ncbi:MAG: efflux RND transporter permease subunit [Fibrobacteres bacterium]|nr:efflux RND transporter permease subunit [Fibrobacterota bacterium]